MDSLVAFLSRHLRPVLFGALLLLGAGVLALFHLKREIEPRLRLDYAVVTASLPGSSAQELAETVTLPVENELRRTAGVATFDSRTVDGLAVFTVKFDKHAGDTLEIRERLRNRLAELRTSLSGNIVGLTGPRIDDTAATPCDFVAGIAAPEGDLAKLRAALPEVTRALRASPLVGDIDVTGLPADRIVVSYNDAELADAGFSPQLVAGMLKSQSFVAPGGYFDDAKTLAGVHTDARLKTLDDLRAVGVLDPVTGRATALDRILDVKVEARTPAAPVVTVAGKPGIRLAVTRAAGADLEKFSAAVRAALETSGTKAGLAKPVVLLDNAAFIRDDYRGFTDGLLTGGVILLVLLVAFMGLRTGALVALTVPLVVLCTLAALLLFGFKLNIVVLAALTIATGVVVDNHIVVAQFVSRRLKRGDARPVALAETFRVLAGPLLAATLVAVAGFLPVLLADHLAGEYLADIVPVMAIALFFSYLFAFTLTPFLCGASNAETGFVAKLEHGYIAALTRILGKPGRVLVVATVVSAAGIALFATRPSSFFPANDRTLLAVEILRPAGTSQNAVAADLAAVDARIADTLQKTGTAAGASRLTLAGGGIPRFSENMAPAFAAPNSGVALIAFDTPAATEKFRYAFGKDFASPGAVVRLRAIGGGPQAAWPVKVVLHGSPEALAVAAPKAEEFLTFTAEEKALGVFPGLSGAHRETGGDIAKWRVTPKRRESADKAVTPADTALALNSVVNGLPCFEIGSGDLAMPVIVRAKRTSADPADNLKDAYVYPAKGRPCLLSDVATVETYKAPACVERERGEAVVTFVADAAPGTNPYDAENNAVAALAKSLPAGVTVTSEGLAKSAAEATHALLVVTPWALAAIFLVLLVQTRSFRLNLVVLSVILFGVAGAGFGLALTGTAAGFMPLIGLTAMAGIAVNVAIVMTASLADSESDKTVSSVETRLARAAGERVEPILLSILCAVGGMAPLYFFGGPLWHGMVITLVSGLLLAAALLVFVIPAAFRMLKR